MRIIQDRPLRNVLSCFPEACFPHYFTIPTLGCHQGLDPSQAAWVYRPSKCGSEACPDFHEKDTQGTPRRTQGTGA